MEVVGSYLAWVAVLVFLFMAVYRVVQYSSMPLFLRWELYPVPTEPRHHYGGSYMEEVDFVKKPRHHERIGGLLDMGSEVFYLKKVKEHNRFGMWPFSLSMHWGIYLLFLWILLILVEGIFNLQIITPVTNACGIVAFILGSFGALMLLLKRAGNEKLAAYTTPDDYFNLLFLLAIFGTGLIGWVIYPSFFADARSFVYGAFLFKPAAVPFLVALNFLLFELFLIYMPFSKLFHYVAKYFTFDKIFWDDAYKVKDSPADRQITKQLGYVVTWSGPHVVPGKTWLEEAQLIEGGEAK
ncbi:MAG: respiratory nitrate reductase subunit gamma [Bacillota bacterium]